MAKSFFLVAGEASGDILGARLIKALKVKYPDASFQGIGGPLMQAEGFISLHDMERLSVMGILPILKRLPELLKMRKTLARQISQAKPDCLIGIDAPEFNLGLEGMVKKAGVATVHYVSPSVWAWREKRIHKIARNVDLMLCLFPFELPIYQKHNVAAACIGHPLADEIPMQPDKAAAQNALGMHPEGPLIAMLPGSRGSEVKFLMPEFLEAAKLIVAKHPKAQFVIPAANQRRQQQIASYLTDEALAPQIRLIAGRSREVMTAADVVLLASGTATLEAMLLKKPMLVAYKISAFSYWVFMKLLKISNFALPNLLAGEPLVQELMQENCTADKLAQGVEDLLAQGEDSAQVRRFYQLHQQLQLGGSQAAADAIEALLQDKL